MSIAVIILVVQGFLVTGVVWGEVFIILGLGVQGLGFSASSGSFLHVFCLGFPVQGFGGLGF